LQASYLNYAHLEAANLVRARLEGASLRNAFFDESSFLGSMTLRDAQLGTALLGGVHWGGTDLSVVDWSQLPVVGEEEDAREPVFYTGKKKSAAIRLEQYQRAVRANRQLATALRGQGLNDYSDQFAYHAQVLQREVLRRQGNLGQWLFSLLLGVLSGYGYRLRRILITYLLTLVIFAAAFLAVGLWQGAALAPQQAFLVSLTAVHGRVFFEQFGLNSALSWVAAVESVVGIVIEGVFVAMLVQRFFAR
jgi:hypothetical protein